MATSFLVRRLFTTAAAVNPKVFLEVTVGEKPPGRMVFELRQDVVPKTAENFLRLCLGTSGTSSSGHQLTFKGSKFHRIIPGFMAQGGDFTRGNGTGGSSVFGDRFADENFKLKHNGKGLLSMANAGPNTNGSQFFITFRETPWLDGHHVVFGKMVAGDDVLMQMEQVGTSNGAPRAKVTITNCGEVKEPPTEEKK